MLESLLSKPIVITPEQISNLQIKVSENNDEITVMSLEDYICSKILDRLYTMLRGE